MTRRSNSILGLICSFVCMAVAYPASAHVLAESAAGWTSGFQHPFSGIDHLLAMIAVGLWAAQNGRPALWVLPVAFPLAMAIGSIAGATGFDVPFIEAWIAGSVVVLGGLIVFVVRPGLPLSAAIVTLFALCHGHAHGTELPVAASQWFYGLGFLSATIVLHATGLGLGTVLRHPFGRRVIQAGAAAIMSIGVTLLVGI